jgi:hypothetical protein
MKQDASMGTLMTVFSGVATLMCLLVGLQLFFLESQISQAAEQGIPAPEDQFRHWRAQAHTGGIMALGAGALIFLFGLRNLTSRARVIPDQPSDSEQQRSIVDIDSVSVRVFEVDAADRSVEITPGTETPGPKTSSPPAPVFPVQVESTFDTTSLEESVPGPESQVDPTDTIIQTIRDAASAVPHRRSVIRLPEFLRLTFLSRLFRRDPGGLP